MLQSSKLLDSIEYWDDGNVRCHYQHDEYFVKNGLYIWFYQNGNMNDVGIFHHGKIHGECLLFYRNGVMAKRTFWCNDREITNEVMKDFDTRHLSDEDKFAIKLRWGIECMPNDIETYYDTHLRPDLTTTT